MNKNKKLNVIRGGVAKQIPGMPNYYFMEGLPHELGGIDIGKDLEVENNEVVHVGKDNIKVYSSVPFLNGISPAEKVLGGYNPTTVFREQEQFKDINGLKDDGTKKELGGEDDDGIDFNYDPDIVGTSPDEIIKYYTNKGFGKSPITNEWGFISRNGYNYNSEGSRDRYDKEFDEVNKIGYIGGSPTEARRKFYKSDKRFTQVVDSIADSHGLPRRVLKNSLANEGFIDTAIRDINTNYLKRRKGEAGYDNLIGDNLLNKHIYNIGFTRMGNDDSKTYYNTRKDVKRIIDNSPIKWGTVRNINEKGREVLTMDGSNNKANIVIHSAILTSFRNEIKKQHPNWTNDQIDNYTLYRFNYGPNANGNINDVMKRDKFNARNYKRLGGESGNTPKFKWVKSNVIGGKPRLVSYNEDIKYDAPKELMTYDRFGPEGGGSFSGGGAGGKIQYTPESYKVETTDTLWVPVRETFNDAFAKARKQGLSKFNFNGKEYTTEVGNNPNNNKAGEQRYIETVVPIERKKVQTKYNRFNRPKSNTYRAGGLYSLTVDGQTKLHQFPSTGESFARSAKGKVVAKLGTEQKTKKLLDNINNRLKKGINPITPTINVTLDNIDPISIPLDKAAKRRIAVQRVKNKVNKLLTPDNTALVSNVMGSVISHGINKSMLDDLEYSPRPVTRRANKLKTKININPQIEAMRESLAEYRQHVNDNTASSRTARALMNRGLSKYVSGVNTIYANKENQETDLINKDRINQQEITNANIADYNNWRTNKVNFDNSIREKKSENDIGLIGNINAGIQDIISRGEKRFNERQNRLALMAANPNVNPLLLRDFGIEGITYEDIRNYYKVYGNKNKKG